MSVEIDVVEKRTDLDFLREKRVLQEISSAISLNCYVGVIIAIASSVLACVVFFVLTNQISQEERLFFVTVVSVTVVGLLLILCLARKDPKTVLIFSTLISLIGGFIAGLAICTIAAELKTK